MSAAEIRARYAPGGAGYTDKYRDMSYSNGKFSAAAPKATTRTSSTNRGYSPSPHRSPEYLEAARSTDAAVSAKVRGFGREAQMVRAELQRALPRLNWEAQDKIGAIDADAEERGLFNAGARLTSGATVRRDLAADYSDLTQRAAETVSGLMAKAAEAQLAGRADLANAALTAAGNLRAQVSEGAVADINRRNAQLQQTLSQLLSQYRSYG